MTAAAAVVGPGGDVPAGLAGAARAVGRGLAAAGVLVVTGGLDGVMAAASRGAAEAGGTVLGLLPGDDAGAANPWVTVAVPTGLGEGRNVLVVRTADVVVAIGGSWGTLSEVALARRAGRPVVSLAGWHVVGPADPGVVEAADADTAVAAALRLLRERAGEWKPA